MSRRIAVPILLAVVAVACGEPPTSSVARPMGAVSLAAATSMLVQFVDPITLFASAPAADYSAGLQSVKGTNTTNKINVPGSSYAMSIAYSMTDVAACDDGGARLTQVVGSRTGTLGITVDKTQFTNGEANAGVVVNFTTIGNDGASYFLTTGGGANRLDESDPAVTRIAKTGGFVRVKKNGERQGALCNGIVDFEFTASR